MMLNVIAHDNYLNVDNAYNSVEVYKGMPTIITTYKDNEADDLTWIIYVVLSIIILAVIIFLILFFNKRK